MNPPDPAQVAYCCKMREKFLLGIVAERSDIPTPVDAADFIDFDATLHGGRLIIEIKFCPFCGKMIMGPLRTFDEEAKR